jgi:hypothetical protein
MTTGAHRYSIMVREGGSDHEFELCRVDTNPENIARAAKNKRLRITSSDRVYLIPQYSWVRVIDNDDACWQSLGDAATKIVQKLRN